MPLTNPWLSGEVPTGFLEASALEDRIRNLLSSANMCVLAAAGDDGPRSTPVRYSSLDFAVTEHWLRRSGHVPRQFWRRDEAHRR